MFGARLNKLGAALKSRPPQAAFNFSLAGQAFDERITYTGASARMYYDSTGTLRYAPMNLLTYSEQFDNAAWNSTTNITITANSETAPDGTLTADTLTHTAASVFGRTPFAISAGSTLTYTLFVKKGNTTYFRLRVANGADSVSCWFNLDTGAAASNTAGTGNVLFSAKSIQAAANGYSRVQLTVTTTVITSLDITMACAASDSGAAANGNTAYIWGAQLNLGPTTFDYIPTTTAAVYLPRSNAYQDHNPATLAPLGFLIEEQRTNSIRNNTMQGAVAGSPGTVPTNWVVTGSGTGVTREIVGTGTESGIAYIDIKVSGTTSGALFFAISPEAFNQIVASNGQVWTASKYVRLVGGSLSNATIKLGISGQDAGGSPINFPTNSTVTPTSAALCTQRLSNTGTLSNASVAFVRSYLLIEAASGAAIDITLRIGLPQLELGAFATSPILTTGAAATRLADVASITGTNFSSFYNQSEGTIVVSGRLVGGTNSTFPRVVALAGSNANTDDMGIPWNVGTGSGALRGTITAGGTTTMDQAVGAVKSAGSFFNAALAYKANDSNAAVDGTAGTTDTSVTLPTVTQLLIGGSARFQPQSNQHLQSLTYYAKRLPNQTLQSLTV
jgi:hypothetical protein